MSWETTAEYNDLKSVMSSEMTVFDIVFMRRRIYRVKIMY